MAQQLQAQDQEVALLVLFDTINPGRLDTLSGIQAIFVRIDGFYRKIWFHLRSMTQLQFGDVPIYLLERLRNVWVITRRTRLSRAAAKFVRPVLPDDPYHILYHIGMRYRPKTYHGRVLLFRRSLRPISRYLDEKLGWSGLIAGEFNVVEIQGGHMDMFCELQVQNTAAKMVECLRD
jgi:oxalate---CoA ligase